MTQRQGEILKSYEQGGHVVHITRKRDGQVLVSLNGGRQISVAAAIKRIKGE